jgi:phosphoglycerate dehydrogenase-like enzyme
MDAEFLDAFPRLRAVFYAAGSVKPFVTEESFRREIVVCSAAAANAIPVAEYTLSMTLLSLKNFWRFERQVRNEHSWHRPRNGAARGAYRSVVGLVSLGAVGRAVARKFSSSDLKLIAYDPFVSPAVAKKLRVTLVSLEELFQTSDVVSIHAPLIPETVNLVDGGLLSQMKRGATFINSSRGATVNQADLCRVMRERPDLTAILDVTYPEPPEENSPLYGQPNIILTPHIAGSLGGEISRMGDWMVEEMQRYLEHAPLLHRIDREKIELMA